MTKAYGNQEISPFKSFARGAALSSVIIGGASFVLRAALPAVFSPVLNILGISQYHTSISFMLAGFSLLLLNGQPSMKNTRRAFILTLCLFLVTLVNIYGYIKIESAFFFAGPGKPDLPGGTLMAPTTSIYFLMMGFTFACMGSRKTIIVSQVLALIGIFIGILNLMGHTYGVPALLQIGNYPQTDLLSTLLFLLLMNACLLSRPEEYIPSVISSPHVGGIIARKLIPIAVSIPFLLGWLRLIGQRAGFYELETGVAITGLFNILIFTVIIWGLAHSLNKIDSDRKRAENKSKETNEKLLGLVGELEQESRKKSLISEMKDLLQTCTNIPETAPIISKFMEQIFPSHDGALLLFSPSRNDLEALASWGGQKDHPDELVFTPDECWALRRGKPHIVLKPEDGIRCPHVRSANPLPYCCVPLTAYGEVLGLLHLRGREQAGPAAEILEDRLIRTAVFPVAEHLAVSLATLKLRETLKNQSIRDPLTGLFNRRYMEETLQREIFRAARKKSSIGIIMVDIDHFKKFNDAYGHKAGDDLLVNMGAFLQNKVRASDVACRYGGEEFTLFIPDVPEDELIRRAEAIRAGAKELKVSSQVQMLGNITISMGIAVYPKHAETSETLLKAADDALYRAKREGRDRAVMA